MTIKQFILCIGILYSFILLYSRVFIGALLVDLLNNSAYRKRSKGQTFWQWFWYTRFRDVIPRWVLISYYMILAFYPSVALLGSALFLIFPALLPFLSSLTKILVILTFVPIILSRIFFADRKTGMYAYERWIPRIKGQTQKRHKKNH